MALGDSPVALDKDVIKQAPRQFFPTVKEWAADGNTEQIIVSNASNGNVTLYTVPDGFTLFITSAWVTCQCIAAGPSARRALVSIGPEGKDIVGASITGQAEANSNALTYSMPLAVTSGISIFGLTTSNSTGRWGFQGFLLPKKVAIR